MKKQTKTVNRTEKSEAPVLAVGTFVVDYHKGIAGYPNERASTQIQQEAISNGGAPFNFLVNLARLGVSFPLHASGKIGKDLDGKFIVETCQKYQIDASQLTYDEHSSTGYTDVFTVNSSGRHTCFHFGGACNALAREDVKMSAVNPKFLFLGALGALAQMGALDPVTKKSDATRLLRDARKRGIETIIVLAPVDVGVSLDTFSATIAEADYVIMNDRVTEDLLGTSLYSENQFDPALARRAAQQLLDCGLRKAVIISSGACAVYLGADGRFFQQSGYLLPWDQRAGSAGVDSAFCAGFFEGLYYGKPTELCLKQGLAVSTVCRKHLTSSEAITSLSECLEFCDQLSLA